MKDKGRYDITGLTEAQFEPGSDDRVLKNLVGITDPVAMDRMEAEALVRVTDALFHEYGQKHRFTANDIRHMHKAWFSSIYEWAGEYRQVNISKDDFSFAMAAQVPKLMHQFEDEQLTKYTPCLFTTREKVVTALAEVHTEFVLIHPFREGNGRTARLLSTLMALQAGLPILNFSSVSGSRKLDYFSAVQMGLDRNYEPMEKLFSEIIERSIRASAE